MNDIAPFLMFSGAMHGKAEEAIGFYVSVFPDSHVERIDRYRSGEDAPAGTVKVASFVLNGRRFMASDSAAPHRFDFTPSLSLFVECASDEGIARIFSALSQAGQILMPLDDYGFSQRFGWTNDRFGVSWQVNLAFNRGNEQHD